MTNPDSPKRIAQGVAHDFYNMVGLVRNNVKFLTARDLPPGVLNDPRVREDFESIREALDQGERLARALAQFSRAQDPAPTIFDINDVVRENEVLLSSLSAINICLTLGDHLHLIKADRVQIGQVMWNLVMNARDAMGPAGGEIIIHTENCICDRIGLYVCLTISDDGPGIALEHQALIFEPFYSAKEGNASDSTGLGLSTVQRIVRRAGGDISVKSVAGEGAAFKVRLPAGLATPRLLLPKLSQPRP